MTDKFLFFFNEITLYYKYTQVIIQSSTKFSFLNAVLRNSANFGKYIIEFQNKLFPKFPKFLYNFFEGGRNYKMR